MHLCQRKVICLFFCFPNKGNSLRPVFTLCEELLQKSDLLCLMRYSKYEVLLQIKLLKAPQPFPLFEILQGFLSAKSAGYKGNLFVLMQNTLYSFMATYIN